MIKNIVVLSSSSLPMKLICWFKSGFSNSICLFKSIAITHSAQLRSEDVLRRPQKRSYGRPHVVLYVTLKDVPYLPPEDVGRGRPNLIS